MGSNEFNQPHPHDYGDRHDDWHFHRCHIRDRDGTRGLLAMMDPLTVTVREAKSLTGLSERTIYKLMKEGRLVRTKVGSRTLISYPSLRAMFDVPVRTYVSTVHRGARWRIVAQ